MCPTRSHAAGTEKMPHLPGSQPAESGSRPKAVDMSVRSHAAGTEETPICQAANLRGAIRAQKLWMCPARSHAAGTEKMPHLPGCQPAGSSSRTKTVNMPHPVTHSRDGENAHLPGSSLRRAVLAQRLWICPARPPQKASGAKQKRHPDRMPFCLVRITGLEPAQYCYH